jgi:hypothetical protein
MKKLMHILALAAVVVGLAGLAATAQAESKIVALDRLQWVRGISSYGAGNTDSTRISIPAATTTSDHADTTEWLDLGQFKFEQDYAKQPLVWFQINRQYSTTTDSVGVEIHYSNDLASSTILRPVTTFYLTTIAAATAGTSAGADGLAGSVVAVSPDANAAHIAGVAAAMPWRYVRVVVYNADVSGATGRTYFSVRPIIYGKP